MTKRELWPENAVVVIHEIGTRSLARPGPVRPRWPFVGWLVWPPFISVPFEKADRDGDRPRSANAKVDLLPQCMMRVQYDL